MDEKKVLKTIDEMLADPWHDTTRAAATCPIVMIAKIVRIYSYSCTKIDAVK